MPMTTSQLAQTDHDYKAFIVGRVVAVEDARSGHLSTCDVCGRPFQEFHHDGSLSRVRASKQLVIALEHEMLRHFRILVCRQGKACRSRRWNQVRRGIRAARVA